MDYLNVALVVIGGLAGFGLSELILVTRISSKVSVHSAEIKNLKEDKSDTNKLLEAIVKQNTVIISKMK